jgi:hypothetical protein
MTPLEKLQLELQLLAKIYAKRNLAKNGMVPATGISTNDQRKQIIMHLNTLYLKVLDYKNEGRLEQGHRNLPSTWKEFEELLGFRLIGVK